MSEIVLVLGLIIFFAIITNGIIINKQRNSMPIDKMGIEIGKRCPEQDLEYVNGKKFQLSELTGTIIFVEEQCMTCQMLVKDIDASGRKDENMVTILVGEKEHAINFIQKYPSWNKIAFWKNEELQKKLNISAFPFYMTLNKGVVKEKGFASVKKILKD